MTEATYTHFAAHLGEATGEVEARLRLAARSTAGSVTTATVPRSTSPGRRAGRRDRCKVYCALSPPGGACLSASWRLAGCSRCRSTNTAPLYPRRVLPNVHGHMRKSRPKLQYPQWRHRSAPARVLLPGLASS